MHSFHADSSRWIVNHDFDPSGSWFRGINWKCLVLQTPRISTGGMPGRLSARDVTLRDWCRVERGADTAPPGWRWITYDNMLVNGCKWYIMLHQTHWFDVLLVVPHHTGSKFINAWKKCPAVLRGGFQLCQRHFVIEISLQVVTWRFRVPNCHRLDGAPWTISSERLLQLPGIPGRICIVHCCSLETLSKFFAWLCCCSFKFVVQDNVWFVMTTEKKYAKSGRTPEGPQHNFNVQLESLDLNVESPAVTSHRVWFIWYLRRSFTVWGQLARMRGLLILGALIAHTVGTAHGYLYGPHILGDMEPWGKRLTKWAAFKALHLFVACNLPSGEVSFIR